jgi:large subunit ribosomal protein L4e
LAATSIPSLVLARGHRIEQVPEIPFVVSCEDINHITKTKEAVKIFEEISII